MSRLRGVERRRARTPAARKGADRRVAGAMDAPCKRGQQGREERKHDVPGVRPSL